MEEAKWLQWDSHTAHVRSLLQDLMITNNFSDVTLVCEDLTMLRAHRNILSAGSQVLKDIFLFEDKIQLGGKQSVIHLRGFNHTVMQAILEYIYLGKTAIPIDGTNDFLLAAKGLGLRDCIDKRTRKYDVDPNITSNGQNLNSFDVHQMETDIKTKLPENHVNIKENITTTPKKLDKSRQITIGFNEAISNFKIKDEVAIATVSDELDLHIDSENEGVHNQSNLNHNCSICDKTFKNAVCLKNHEKDVHGVSRKRIFCPHCEYTCFQQRIMKSHIDFVHNNRKYPCEICGKLFANNLSLSAHVMNIHERSQMFYCEQCDYKAVTKYGLQNHILAKHDKVLFKCGQCDKKYSYMQQLHVHKEAVHEGTRFSCDSCSFQAAYKGDLRAHKKIVHEGIRRKCDECDYQSKHTRELRNHMKRQHQKNVSFKKGVISQLEDANPRLNSADTDTGTDTN